MRFLVNLYVVLSAALLFVSCKKAPSQYDDPIPDQLLLMERIYLEHFNTAVDSNGYIVTDRCDSLFWSSLSNPNINLSATEVGPGEYIRRPSNYLLCSPENNNSASTISRDMLLGVIYRSVQTGDLAALQRLWVYGETHGWNMGRGDSSATLMTPYMISTLAQAIYKLSGGENNYVVRNTPAVVGVPGPGYAKHLQAIQILIRMEVFGGISNNEFNVMQNIYNSATWNPLYAILVNKDFETVRQKIIELFPNNRLPNSSDWCSDWILSQSTDDDGKKPCPDRPILHTGGEYLFLLEVLRSRGAM